MIAGRDVRCWRRSLFSDLRIFLQLKRNLLFIIILALENSAPSGGERNQNTAAYEGGGGRGWTPIREEHRSALQPTRHRPCPLNKSVWGTFLFKAANRWIFIGQQSGKPNSTGWVVLSMGDENNDQ